MNKNDHMQQRQQQQNEILTQLNLNFNKIRGVLMWIEPNKPSFKCFIYSIAWLSRILINDIVIST